ncbi:spore-associated protein A [Streptomyces spectabilis]|uniref:Spore-associated protein A n=1 Tax=Streptomyces spectabilis TaxID=68270 RepID=A0A516R190_STRST|nr:spore-associated protein A [Streptomyces spectabilis]QDQ09416.1 spore-associated protein A [Streptomyces spectabilis]
MERRGYIRVAGAAVALAAGGVMATATGAAAAPPTAAAAAAYNKVCGPGYKVVNQIDIGKAGTSYLTYSSVTGKNCAVTIRTTAGPAVHMYVWVQRDDTRDYADDDGSYRSYAGPVYLDARGYCVSWGSVIAGESAGRSGTNCGRIAR